MANLRRDTHPQAWLIEGAPDTALDPVCNFYEAVADDPAALSAVLNRGSLPPSIGRIAEEAAGMYRGSGVADERHVRAASVLASLLKSRGDEFLGYDLGTQIAIRRRLRAAGDVGSEAARVLALGAYLDRLGEAAASRPPFQEPPNRPG